MDLNEYVVRNKLTKSDIMAMCIEEHQCVRDFGLLCFSPMLLKLVDNSNPNHVELYLPIRNYKRLMEDFPDVVNIMGISKDSKMSQWAYDEDFEKSICNKLKIDHGKLNELFLQNIEGKKWIICR